MTQKHTKLQWWNLGYDLNEDAVGSEEWNNRYCTFKVFRYTDDEVHPDEYARRKYLDHKKEASKRCYDKRKQIIAAQKRDAFQHQFTSWQLLNYYHRIPLEGHTPELRKNPMREKRYYYYDIDKSIIVDEKRFEELKALYIEKYGGWETIDLDKTTYDGRIWW